MYARSICIVLVISLLVVFGYGREKENPKSPEAVPKEIVSKDGAKMMLIPTGEFMMGSHRGSSNERPVHTVYLDAFWPT